MPIDFFSAIPKAYWLGLFGSAGVELAALNAYLQSNNGDWPSPYQKWSYRITRIIFTLFFAAPLPLILLPDEFQPIAAIYLGASAPLVFSKLSEGILPDLKGKSVIEDQSETN